MNKIVLSQSSNFQFHCPDSKKYGSVCYNTQVFNTISIPYVYKQHIQIEKLEREVNTLYQCTISVESIRQPVKNQSTIFPTNGTFHYWSIITQDGSINEGTLNKHFDEQLLAFVNTITKSEHSKTRHWYIPLVDLGVHVGLIQYLSMDPTGLNVEQLYKNSLQTVFGDFLLITSIFESSLQRVQVKVAQVQKNNWICSLDRLVSEGIQMTHNPHVHWRSWSLESLKIMQLGIMVQLTWTHKHVCTWHTHTRRYIFTTVSRNIVWDGGLKQFAFQCGYWLKQWQELYLMVMATHEVLIMKAVTEFKSQLSSSNIVLPKSYGTLFWKWIREVSNTGPSIIFLGKNADDTKLLHRVLCIRMIR